MGMDRRIVVLTVTSTGRGVVACRWVTGTAVLRSCGAVEAGRRGGAALLVDMSCEPRHTGSFFC